MQLVNANNVDVHAVKEGLKSLIVERLQLAIDPASIRDEAPLFGAPDAAAPAGDPADGGLALDSVEALEIVVGIEERWGVVIEDDSVAKEFYSIDTLSGLVSRLLAQQREAGSEAHA